MMLRRDAEEDLPVDTLRSFLHAGAPFYGLKHQGFSHMS